MQLDRPIKMVDLYSQYLQIKPRIDAAIQNIIENSAFVKGKVVTEFEIQLAHYLNVGKVISCANGTDALQIAMMTLGLKPGDEIIVPVFTYVATAEVIALLGLVPVMVDVNVDDFCIDIAEIEAMITPRTKAIVPVHLFGQCADMEAVLEIAKKYNLFVIEDTAQALGSIYTFSDGSQRRAGTIGDIGTTSFFPSKNLGCFGDGGALMTNKLSFSDKISMISNHGQSVQYQHDIVGVNSRLDGIQAAILIEKLKELDSYENKRNLVADFYDKHLIELNFLKIPKRKKNSTHVFHQYTLVVEPQLRDKLRQHLDKFGIPTMVYYPIPLHQQKAFSQYCMEGENFENAEMLCKTVVSLPIHTEMSTTELNIIVDEIYRFKKLMNL